MVFSPIAIFIRGICVSIGKIYLIHDFIKMGKQRFSVFKKTAIYKLENKN
jgi:hypothetical protein